MVFLGDGFIISSLVWLTVVGVFIFVFRKQIISFFYGNSSFYDFISQLKIYLEKNHPGIKFDFSIIEDSKKEKNPTARKYLIVDNIIKQFENLQLDSSKYPKSTPKELQWSSYVFNCEPNKDKEPKDWSQRKAALLTRDGSKCFRCTKPLKILDTQVHMIFPLHKGGKYYLENLLPVCKDCYRLLDIDPDQRGNLQIKSDLYDIVKLHT